MARNKDKDKNLSNIPLQDPTRFKITKAKLDEMYKDDESITRNVDRQQAASTTIGSLTAESFSSSFFNVGSIDTVRKYSKEAYAYYPLYATVLDYLANFFTWDYTYIPRLVKEKKASSTNYEEIYKLMGEVVDGLNVETAFPLVLTNMLIQGAVYLYAVKSNSSKTIATLSMPPKYCRQNSVTQFGTYTYQFNFQYFDDLGLNADELERIFEFYPSELKQKYEDYKRDKKLQWQVLNPRFAAALSINDIGVPTLLNALAAIKRYDVYNNNALERDSQQLDRIISHKIPVWEDKLIIDMDEMSALHNSIAAVLAKNKHTKFITTYGDVDAHEIGTDQTKDNKTLANALKTVFDNLGENNSLFTGESANALLYSLKRDESFVWKYVNQLVNFYNIAINNCFNFKGYQCDFKILPITVYNKSEMLNFYREGATLGVSKLEYIVATGTKQINIESKIELEQFLKLDQLKPLSTSYTQKDNEETINKEKTDEKQTGTINEQEVDGDNENIEENKDNKEQEVDNDNENSN